MLGLLFLVAALSADLQREMGRQMAGRSGAAVVLDVQSGRILAHHRLDIAARRLARPGSVIKPFTLMALLGAGAPAKAAPCPRTLRIGARQLDCTHPRSLEPLDPVAALAYSCNHYFASRAAGMRNTDLVEVFTRAGLISRTALHEGEAIGELIPPSSVEARQLLALGEANIRVTPLAMVSAYRKLALMNKPPALAPVFGGLAAATEYGTARLAQPAGLRVAGKTGTSSEHGSGRVHAWFAGYAPAEAPRMAVVVFLEQGVGGRDAAPIAGALFQAALQ